MNLPSGRFPDSDRLRFKLPSRHDAAFYLKLMNEPDYLHFIADHGLRTEEDVIEYIENKTLARFTKFGVGLWLVEEKDSGSPVGVCGIVVRRELEHPDLGYGLLEAHRGKGYAKEAAEAVLEFARKKLGLKTICAITHPDNVRSAHLLTKIGFVQDGQRELSEIGSTADFYILDL